MRNIITASALVILLALPHAAAAGTLTGLTGSADCSGWAADLTIAFRTNALMARVEYTVVLQDADGFEVDSFTFADFIDIPGTPEATFRFEGAWAAAPDGHYMVSGSFMVYDIFGDGYNTTSDSFDLPLSCGSAGGEDTPDASACAFTSRHWYENPGDWPVGTLEIGGKSMDQAEMLNVLAMEGNRFLTFALMREVIAAKLNLAAGATGDVEGLLADADALLASAPSSRREVGRTRGQAMRLRAALYRFNRSGCPDKAGGLSMSMDDGSFAGGALDKAAVEVMSLGSVKALYR